MAYGNEKYTDEELKQALIEANEQPTKAAEVLDVITCLSFVFAKILNYTRCKRHTEQGHFKRCTEHSPYWNNART